MRGYVMEFKSDRDWEIRVLKKMLKRSGYFKILFFIWIPFFILEFYIGFHYCTKYGLLYGFPYFVQPFIIALIPILPHLKPKTYKTHLRGIFINGALHRWKNFHSYFTDDEFLYLTKKVLRWKVISLVLPREFEVVVKEFLKGDEYDRDGDREVQQVSQSRG